MNLLVLTIQFMVGKKMTWLVMAFFDPHRTTKLIVDGTKETVLGSILKQYHPAKSDTKL